MSSTVEPIVAAPNPRGTDAPIDAVIAPPEEPADDEFYLNQTLIEECLAANPGQIRDMARGLAKGFRDEIARLNRSRPNDPERLANHEEQTKFLAKAATELDRFAGALDDAITLEDTSGPDQTFIRKAAEIAKKLYESLIKFLAKNHSAAWTLSIKVTLLLGGVSFLTAIGANTPFAIGALATILIKSPIGAKTPQSSRAPPSKPPKPRRR